MSRAGLLLSLAILAGACSGGSDTVDTIPASPSTPTIAPTTTPAAPDMGDVDGFPTTTLLLDGTELLVAVADDPSRRSQGLRGVVDFGDLAGMLFEFDGPVTAVFTMQDTPTPLDLILLDEDGAVLEVLVMDPCDGNDCRFPPTVVYHYALEVRQGSLDVAVGDRLELPTVDN